MKLSISNIAWKKEENTKISSLLKDFNIKYIDIAPLLVVDTLEKYTQKEIKNCFDCFYRNNIKALGMQSIFYEIKDIKIFLNNNSVLFLNYFKKVVKFAKLMKIQRIVFGCPSQRHIFPETKNRDVFLFFKEITKICKKNKIYLCLEPNAKEYGSNFINTTRDAFEYVKRLDSKYAKINLDTSSAILNNNNPSLMFHTFKSHIGHIHLSKPMLKPIDSKFMDHKDFSGILKKEKYNLGISIEMLTEKYNVESEIAITNALSVFRDFYM